MGCFNSQRIPIVCMYHQGHYCSKEKSKYSNIA